MTNIVPLLHDFAKDFYSFPMAVASISTSIPSNASLGTGISVLTGNFLSGHIALKFLDDYFKLISIMIHHQRGHFYYRLQRGALRCQRCLYIFQCMLYLSPERTTQSTGCIFFPSLSGYINNLTARRYDRHMRKPLRRRVKKTGWIVALLRRCLCHNH